ncbi:hypothetical protein, partial [Listeria monocytogenes]|uniref:hypothetical protein n=1 Tax=Listeria monocytogenes TaxID=1639 RepID=UPI002FDC2F97
LIEYNSSIYNVDARLPVVPTANVSYSSQPRLLSVVVTEGLDRASDGTIYAYMELLFQHTDTTRIEVLRDGQKIGESRTNVVRLNNVVG